MGLPVATADRGVLAGAEHRLELAGSRDIGCAAAIAGPVAVQAVATGIQPTAPARVTHVANWLVTTSLVCHVNNR